MTTTMMTVTTTELPAPADADPEWVCIFFCFNREGDLLFCKEKTCIRGKK